MSRVGGFLNLMAERNVNFKVDESNVSTTLAQAASLDTILKKDYITVANASLFKVNNTLKISNGSTAEINLTVDSIEAGNKIRLKEKLKYNWAAGAEVRKVSTLFPPWSITPSIHFISFSSRPSLASSGPGSTSARSSPATPSSLPSPSYSSASAT